MNDQEYKMRLIFGTIAFLNIIGCLFLFFIMLYTVEVRYLYSIIFLMLFNLIIMPLSKYGSYRYWKKCYLED